MTLYARVCKVCGKSFEARSPRALYCCAEHAHARRGGRNQPRSPEREQLTAWVYSRDKRALERIARDRGVSLCTIAQEVITEYLHGNGS